MSALPIHGLILAGGLSSRMQRDKALLQYDGAAQLDRVHALAARHLSRIFVSVRADQLTEPTRSRHPLIVDSVDGGGPIVGIRSALAAYPDTAWLVLACDLPFLRDTVLTRLLAERDPGMLATAYISAHDGLPEPLCAIWEPAAAAALTAYQDAGGKCPRKFLTTHPIKLLAPEDAQALDNVNTPDEYREAVDALRRSPVPSPIALTIQYFALLREQAGCSQETLQTTAATPAELFLELAARHRFTLSREQLKVAINNEFAEWSRGLRAGDAVVFIPPVAGG